MFRLLDLASELREVVGPYGVKVIEVAGWQNRGFDFPRRPRGALRHWTAGPRTGYTPSLKTVTFGRGGEKPLPGPLSQLFQARNLSGPDDLYVVAAGIANHAGAGHWADLRGGNSITTGLEIEWSGPGESFSEQRILVSELAITTLIRLSDGRDPRRACEHREWADPEGRKIDTNLSGDVLRDRVAKLLVTGPKPTPTPEPPEDDMQPAPVIRIHPDTGAEWIISKGPGGDCRARVEGGTTVSFGGNFDSGFSVDPVPGPAGSMRVAGTAPDGRVFVATLNASGPYGANVPWSSK